MLPWLGLFNKINNADFWVILDHTKNNPRDAAFWGRRVKILVNGTDKWLSLPLKRPNSSGIIGVPISEMEFNNADPRIFSNAVRLIETSYKKSPFFSEVFPFVEEFLLSNEMNMSKRNLKFIFKIMDLLDIKTRFCFSSDLDCKENSTELLVEITQKQNGQVYLCGGGATGYQQDELFHKAGIQVVYNSFVHPIYPQLNCNTFVPGLSIIDALMNLGIYETQKLIRNESTIGKSDEKNLHIT